MKYITKYPFTPELLDALPEELAELYRNLELTLLREICSRLKAADQLNEVTLQDIRTLRSHGLNMEDIEKAIAETAGISREKLRKLLNEAAERNEKYFGDMADIAQITAPERLLSVEDIAAIYLQTEDTLENITRSMGFVTRRGGVEIVLPLRDAYVSALDSALMQVQSGAVSYDQAIAGEIGKLAAGGIRSVEYSSGKVDNIDVAVRRAVMTGVSQLNDQYVEQAMTAMDTPYCEISAHAGARDVCRDPSRPWQDHKSWQGKVYSMRPSDKYPSIYEVCGWREVDGLEGANCRHRRFPFIEGFSERTYTDEQLEHIDDGLSLDYEGRHYTAYEATQKQRKIERSIRKQKRLEAAYRAAGLDDKANAAGAKLRRLEEKYREFSKAAKLPEQWERARAGYEDDKPIQAAGGGSYGQSAGNTNTGKPGVPVQIGTLNFSDRGAVLAQIDAAQAETAELKHEVNYTVTTDGKIWRVEGEAGEVHPECIPSSLTGSYSYHNHPAAQTWFSFSADDVRFFFESGAEYAKASDYLYEYFMERMPDTLAVPPEMVYHRFNEIYWREAMRLAAGELIDADVDAYHEVMLCLSREYRFYYERRGRSDN